VSTLSNSNVCELHVYFNLTHHILLYALNWMTWQSC